MSNGVNEREEPAPSTLGIINRLRAVHAEILAHHKTLTQADILLATKLFDWNTELCVAVLELGALSIPSVSAGRSPAEVPPNWNAFEEVKQARAELARAWGNDVQGNIDMAIRPSDLFDKLCAAVWRSAQQ